MSSKPIRDFTTAIDVQDGDEYVLERSGDNYKITGATLRSELSTGGSSSFPLNWCVLDVAEQTLTPGSSYYDILAADLSIFAQSGSDFSIGTDSDFSDGAVVSGAGGVFQALCFLTSNVLTAALDVGSSATRYFGVGLSMGPLAGDAATFTGVGVDGQVTLRQPSGLPPGVAYTFQGVPGYVAPGGSVFAGAFFNLAGASGTDSVTWGMKIYIWQTGTLPA